jgi:hypothetical protein
MSDFIIPKDKNDTLNAVFFRINCIAHSLHDIWKVIKATPDSQPILPFSY